MTYFTVLLTAINCGAINRPVYKIILTQKGFTQFLQYDIDTPPLREFTFCTWIKFRDFTRDQTLFNYIVHGKDHILRLWLDSGGRHLKISLNGKTSSSYPVNLAQDVWQHICLSYQSDYGAWALYIDSRLVTCEVAPSLQGFVLPAGGSVIIGYGTSNDGAPGGFEGEIFGANMILSSTIERNHTMKRNPKLRQKYFHRNKVTGSNDIKYIILGDMQSATSHQDFETTSSIPSGTQSYVSIRTPYSVVEHDVGIDLTSGNNDALIRNKVNWGDPVLKKGINDDDKISFNNIMDDATMTRPFKEQQFNFKQLNKGPSVSLYEQPPPAGSVIDYSKFSTNSVKELFGSHNMSKFTRKTVKLQNNVISYNKPRTLVSLDNDVLTNSRSNSHFANSVLNFLKNNNINLKLDHKRVPPTIPLFKISDSFPYASDFRASKAYTPYIFQRKNLFDKPYKIMKRDVQNHRINVQDIQNDDIRNQILKSHSNLNPTKVEVTNWGEIKSKKDLRVYRNIGNSVPETIISDVFIPRPFSVVSNKRNKTLTPFDFQKNSINAILPFIKSSESESNPDIKINQNDVYTRSLSTPNKWHNVKSYNNDYSPRKIQTELSENKDDKMETYNKKLPSIRLKYIPDNHKIVKNIDSDILKGRDLALEVSNVSEPFTDSVSILKYNHGFLPSRNKKRKESQFDKNIKIGNALNERAIIGDDDIDKYKSFIGGNEKIPDINSYRSDLDKVNEEVPPSLGSKICKNLELFDRLLYIQPDGSIDVTHILSPVKEKNLGIAFVIQNYKKCALQESMMEDHSLLFIDWSNTPVRLFGGAKPKKTTDLCGFF
ncbi:uncharacterized protein LOC123718393 [Pieris brassicae]|uniref:uncharacterized protein LOC123718393 n=1 Tax=Pieris brassicae TaxID=7116 RepID=UPI001E65EF3B|nr:uncharacterized protein LOC123718393 [Pieris brassicae]